MTETRYKDRTYLGDYDLDIELFNKFDLNVEDVIPIRKVYIAKTKDADVVLKKIDYSISELKFINDAIRYLNEHGFKKTFNYVKCKDGNLYTEWNGDTYCVMTHINGRESQLMNPLELKLICKSIAELHKSSKGFSCDFKQRDNRGKIINKFYDKLNNLLLYKRIVSKYNILNEFDNIFIENIDYYINESKKSIETLEKSKYYDMCRDEQFCVLCHHDLAYHNILMVENDCYFIDFDYSIIDLKVHDLCNFINKVMKAYSFDIDITKQILKNYMRYNSLSKGELQILYGMLLFPEDFYSISNAYYGQQKNWEYSQFLRRFIKKASYKEERGEFLKKFKEEILLQI